MKSKIVKLKEIGPYVGAAAPLFCGIAVFFLYMYASQFEGPYSPSNWVLVSSTEFKGVNLVYGMLFASLVTVLLGTLAYGGELKKMESLANGTGGIFKIRRAFKILRWMGVILLVYFLYPLFLRGTIPDNDICNLSALHDFVHRHDRLVIALFATFAVVDLLTWKGMTQSRDELEISDEEKSQSAAFTAEFSKLQLLLIDIPVLFGALVSLLITSFSLGYSGWNEKLLTLDPRVDELIHSGKSLDIVRCMGEGLSLQQFQESVSGIFIAGISMGYLAAHIIMSQLIFIFLNIVHDRRIDKISEPGTIEMSEVIA